jgi:flagellum-specific peptidoglycan hydrolase FlgJ
MKKALILCILAIFTLTPFVSSAQQSTTAVTATVQQTTQPSTSLQSCNLTESSDEDKKNCYELLEPLPGSNGLLSGINIGTTDTEGKGLGGFMNFIFEIGIGVAGVLGVVMLTIYGFQYAANDKNINTFSVLKERLQEKKEKKKKIEDVLERMQNAKRDAQRQMHVAESNASTLSSQLKSIEEDDTDEQTESLKRIAEEAKKNIEERQLEKRKTEKKIVFHQMVEEILGEKGVKQMAIKTILPTFNAEISRLVKMMGIEHRVQFDEEFNARITHFGIEVSADTFSTGESNKVDFAVLLSIIRMMKIKYPSLNMLFLDELFSSIDGDGIYHILKILRETVKEYKMNIFVISHYPLAQTEFDYRLEVTKNNGFSSFELEKIR